MSRGDFMRAGARLGLAGLVEPRRARRVVTGSLEWGTISKLATLAAAPQAADGR